MGAEAYLLINLTHGFFYLCLKTVKFNNAIYIKVNILSPQPSRELAEQTCTQITKFKKYLENPKIRELLVVGGINVKDQINALNAGIDIVVGTPGRLEDLIQGGNHHLIVMTLIS